MCIHRSRSQVCDEVKGSRTKCKLKHRLNDETMEGTPADDTDPLKEKLEWLKVQFEPRTGQSSLDGPRRKTVHRGAQAAYGRSSNNV